MADRVGAVKIHGLPSLERAFRDLRHDVLLELKPALLEVAQSVADEAESLARSEITNIGPDWYKMRAGVTLKGAYVVERQKRHGGRPTSKFSDIVMEKAMEPAFEKKAWIVEQRMNELITINAAKHGFF